MTGVEFIEENGGAPELTPALQDGKPKWGHDIERQNSTLGGVNREQSYRRTQPLQT